MKPLGRSNKPNPMTATECMLAHEMIIKLNERGSLENRTWNPLRGIEIVKLELMRRLEIQTIPAQVWK